MVNKTKASLKAKLQKLKTQLNNLDEWESNHTDPPQVVSEALEIQRDILEHDIESITNRLRMVKSNE